MTDVALEKPKRRWLKMGCELEGSWERNFREVAAEVRGAQGKTDGSVGNGAPLRGGYPGEITTKPWDGLDGLCEDVTTLWPNHVNHTCGFHIHTSFTELDTSALADNAFWKFFLARWEAWGKAHEDEMTKDERSWFWDRLEAKSDKARQYCKREFKPEDQLTSHEDRYTAINFVSWSKYKTVEVRFLPMFIKPEMACKAIRELSSIYDDYLNKYDFPKIEMESELQSLGEMVLEEVKMIQPELAYFEEERPCIKLKPVPVGDDVFYRFRGVMPVFPGEPSEDLQEP